jgi:molybdenum cofactor cytidylyltransferase
MIVALVPAAGGSKRMGQPKLLLRIGDSTVIARVVSALRAGGVGRVVVVAPPRDVRESLDLQREAESAGAEVVVPEARPIDMRASVERGLAYLESSEEQPTTVLLAPADSPGITARLVARVIDRSREAPNSIIVPMVEDRRGHPVALPWNVALSVRTLPLDVGVNAVLRAREELVDEIDVDDAGAVGDLDTPEDYRRWAGIAAP